MRNAKFDLLMREADDIAAKVELFPDAVKEAAFKAMVDTLLAGSNADIDISEARSQMDADVPIDGESPNNLEKPVADFTEEISNIYRRIKYRRLNDMEFCTFVAYYFTRLSHEPQLVDGINEQHVFDVSRIVGRTKPSNPRSSLHNASHHGKFLERVGKGVFALTEKGANFVAEIIGEEVP